MKRPRQEPKSESAHVSDVRGPPGTPDAGAVATAKMDGSAPEPIVPRKVPPPLGAAWSVQRGCLLVCSPRRPNPFAAARKSNGSPSSLSSAVSRRTKAAAFDLDNTLVLWRARWPSRLDQYELWSKRVITKLRSLHDEGYLLVIFSNQGGVRAAFSGKRAAKARALVDWLAAEVDRPICAVMSTDKKKGYHKPDPKMWEVCEEDCNGGVRIDVSASFYVGDSAGDGTEGSAGNVSDSYQDEGVDRLFAENVSKLHGATLKFSTPDEFFGESDSAKRKAVLAMAAHDEASAEALRVRAALAGGYLRGPILLVLCGAQGSGKSTFCSRLCGEENSKEGVSRKWVHLSQDTIRKGKPGTREAVEKAAFAALEAGHSVVIDRMHLDREQRSHFVAVAIEAEVPAHAIVLEPPKELLMARVRDRTDHPGGVHGTQGARMAAGSIERMVPPKYDEMFELLSRAITVEAANRLADDYSRVLQPTKKEDYGKKTPKRIGPVLLPNIVLSTSTYEGGNEGGTVLSLPLVALGTQKVGKSAAPAAVTLAIRSGIRAVDTAPTYNNEEEVGHGIAELKDGNGRGCFVIVKVPKRATSPRQVREEVSASLDRLGLTFADLLLLHWPCDLIDIGTLGAVWSELEQLQSEGKCRSLGVSNFSAGALRALLPLCKSARPVVNQVERHPLLPQWDVVDFCMRQGITVQAHTPLGGGRVDLLEHSTVVRVANEAGWTAGQVLLLWNLRHGVPVVVKATGDGHVKEVVQVQKADVLLNSGHMEMLDDIASKQLGGSTVRFVSPPFMYKPGAPYSWGDRLPSKG